VALLLILIIGLAEVALLTWRGADPLTAVTTPWKLSAISLLMVLAFAARYLRPYLLAPPEPTPEPQPILNPIEIERERIERWSKRGW
jgi:hypothetical protein